MLHILRTLRYALFFFVNLSLIFTSCTSKSNDDTTTATSSAQPTYAVAQPTAREVQEAAAQAVLDTARIALRANGFEAARSKAQSIRTRFPKALNAREDAILLIDSAEIFEAAARVARLDGTGLVETDEATAIDRAKAADKLEYFHQKLARDIATRHEHP
ncbi:MAG: hypothetical protein IJ786_03255 [Bacteroidaceae bacterium]|nr:hypothetical protein [Bacteroidaceae bacterium]